VFTLWASITLPIHIDIIEYAINVASSSLIYDFPTYLLIMCLSSFALYRCHINLATLKNVLCLIVISIIINVVAIFCQNYIVPFIMVPLHKYANYFDRETFFFICSCVSILLRYIIIGLISYYGVFGLKNIFDREIDSNVISSVNSINIHLALFVMLFMSLSLLFLGSLLSLLSRHLMVVSYLLTVIIVAAIVYFSVKNCFFANFDTLQISRIVKSLVLSFILSTIINVFISIAISSYFTTFANGPYRNNQSSLILIMLLGFVLQLVLTCLILRAVIRRYFGFAQLMKLCLDNDRISKNVL